MATLSGSLFLATLVSVAAGKTSLSIRFDGDIMLGGLFPVHEKGANENTCGKINLERGIQRLEAMKFAVADVNKDRKLLAGLTLGYEILDTCSDETYALDQSLEFVMSTFTQQTQCATPEPNTVRKRSKPLMAVIGGAYSDVSIQIASLLRLFQIPQISYASTSAKLSDKERYGFFMRTVPPDTLQARALADIVQYFNWTYVSTVASEGEYGESGIAAFQTNYERRGQCLAAQLKIGRTPKRDDFIEVVQSLYRLKNARVVVLFVEQDHAAGVLSAAQSLGLVDYFIWLASDGWGDALKVVDGNEVAARGALTITLQSKVIQQFSDYFLNLTPQNNEENVWFREYWQAVHSCQFSDPVYRDPATLPAGELPSCTGNETLGKFQQESKVQFVYDAVYAVAVAADRLYREYCGENATRLCERMVSGNSTRQTLLKYIKENRMPNPYGNAIRFDEFGDSLGFYNVMNYRYDEGKGRYEYAVVGSWEDNQLDLDVGRIVWPGPDLPGAPLSMCSIECELGWRKDVKDDKGCCWNCIKCKDHQYLADEVTCKDCPTGQQPDANKTSCVELPLQHIRWESPFAIIPAVLSFIGLMVTVGVVVVFVRHRDTPVVRASGRELSFMLLTGCIVCYTGVFVLLIKPSPASCAVQRFVVGTGFAIIYSALLVKTNRIYRIFNSAKRTIKRPVCISPKSQIIIAALLASAQAVVYVVWLILERPGTRTEIPNPADRTYVVLKCEMKESSLLISLAYNMLLIIVCTVYAALTRKIPSSFNESKFIGFTMYTTCIIWLSFVPIYFGLKSSFQIQITTLCTAVFLSSTVALLCLFGPKVHIILFQPHKNTRKSTTERQRFSANSKFNKTDTEFMAESPNRSRTSSFTCSPLHTAGNMSAKNSSASKTTVYKLRDKAIPEEMTSSLLQGNESPSAHTSCPAADSNTLGVPSLRVARDCKDKQVQTTPDKGPRGLHGSQQPLNADADRASRVPAGSEHADDPVALEQLKKRSLLNLNITLLDSLDTLTNNWDYVDDSSASTCTPEAPPTSCLNADGDPAVVRVREKSVDKMNGHANNTAGINRSRPSLAEPDDDELPERLI